MTADHYRSSNPNPSPNPNPNPNPNRSSAVICGVQADRIHRESLKWWTTEIGMPNTSCRN